MYVNNPNRMPYNAPWKKVYRRIECYNEFRRMIREYLEKCYATHGVSTYEHIGGRSNMPGDPTGKRAIMIAEMPKHIRRAIKWVKAVDRTLDELDDIDMAEGRERDHGMRHMLVLFTDNRTRCGDGWRTQPCRSELTKVAMRDCNISRRTYQRWKQQICEMIAQRLGLMN